MKNYRNYSQRQMNIDIELYWPRIKNGEEYALEKAYKAAYGALVHYAGELTGEARLAEEVVQDVFLKIWQNRSSLLIKDSFRAYLFRTVHNHSLNALRQQNTAKESVNKLGSEKSWQFIADNYDVDDILIEKIFSEETEAIINKIIDGLPDQCRKVFIMSRFESLDNERIAEQLGLSENTVKTHIYRAIHKITLALAKGK